jgi:hypothetical protein
MITHSFRILVFIHFEPNGTTKIFFRRPILEFLHKDFIFMQKPYIFQLYPHPAWLFTSFVGECAERGQKAEEAPEGSYLPATM